jgi:hypothetical protein
MPVTYDLQKEGLDYETIRACDSSAVDDVCGSTAGGPSGTEIKKAFKG